jgi:hypothetical protein
MTGAKHMGVILPHDVGSRCEGAFHIDAFVLDQKLTAPSFPEDGCVFRHSHQLSKLGLHKIVDLVLGDERCPGRQAPKMFGVPTVNCEDLVLPNITINAARNPPSVSLLNQVWVGHSLVLRLGNPIWPNEPKSSTQCQEHFGFLL